MLLEVLSPLSAQGPLASTTSTLAKLVRVHFSTLNLKKLETYLAVLDELLIPLRNNFRVASLYCCNQKGLQQGHACFKCSLIKEM